MATFLDIGLLKSVSIIFPFLLVFVGVYAVLTKVPVLSKDKGINSIIALCVAALTLLSKDAVNVILIITPYFLLLMLIIFFVIFALQFASGEGVKIGLGQKWDTFHWVIFIAVILILLYGLSAVFGPRLSEGPQGPTVTGGISGEGPLLQPPGSSGFEAGAREILFHPKVLGAALLLLIATFTVMKLGE